MEQNFHKLDTLPDLRPPKKGRSLPLPEKIGPYKIESLLNQGGMSLLYLGLHPKSAEPIALKVLLPKYLKNKEISARFLNEAKIIESTHHPNIVKLYDVGEWEKGLYIAMEFIRGVSLRQFIQKKSFSLKRALEIILEVAHALSHLHSHGVIHRDLKPENILITENGSIKLIDFGIAQLQDEVDKNLAQKRMGTPFYMSPEQLENPNKVSFLTDIYAIGIIAYELILGKSTHGIIHLERLTSPLKKIIEKTLQANPKLRYQNILDFITDISLYLQELDDKKEEASSPDLSHIDYVQSLLIPTKIRSPQVEIAIGVERKAPPGSPYLEVLPLADNKLAIVLAESIHSDIASLTDTAVLRGMVRMMMQQDHALEKPNQIIARLNTAVHKDSKINQFRFSLLLLTPEKNLLSFISCGFTDLWHIEEGSQKVRELSTPNPLLGSAANTIFIETNDNWNSGDMIILHSIQATNKTPEEIFLSIANERKLLSPQHLANKLQTSLLNASSHETSSVLVAIHRIF